MALDSKDTANLGGNGKIDDHVKDVLQLHRSLTTLPCLLRDRSSSCRLLHVLMSLPLVWTWANHSIPIESWQPSAFVTVRILSSMLVSLCITCAWYMSVLTKCVLQSTQHQSCLDSRLVIQDLTFSRKLSLPIVPVYIHDGLVSSSWLYSCTWWCPPSISCKWHPSSSLVQRSFSSDTISCTNGYVLCKAELMIFDLDVPCMFVCSCLLTTSIFFPRS